MIVVLFDPRRPTLVPVEAIEHLTGDLIGLLDDPEDAIGACLQKLGMPFDSTDERQLQAAKAQAIRQKQLLRAYLNAEVRDQLVSGDVLAAHMTGFGDGGGVNCCGLCVMTNRAQRLAVCQVR